MPSLNKVAVVAGGTGGIGRAICLTLAAEGFDIAFTYRTNHQGADSLAGQIAALGQRVQSASLALEDAEAVASFVANVAQTFGGISSAIYAAGPDLKLRSIADLTAKDWSNVIDVDVKGSFHLFSSALPHLRTAENGTVVAVVTAAVERVPSHDILSAAPKAAVEMLVRGIAKEEGRHGIRANCVGPGWIGKSGMGARLMDTSLSQSYIDKTLKSIPLRKFGEPQDIADAVAFLISTKAKFVTGQTIAVDGGAQV
jgi:NAD(P)-dependent dehydrogenase (short-subunit alcohol dehydrogenase family)